MLWVKLGALNPSIPVKFGMGLLLLGVGFFVLAWGSQFIGNGSRQPDVARRPPTSSTPSGSCASVRSG
jgi:dipeptide/tripeptide permease